MSKAYENSHPNIIEFSNDPILTLVSTLNNTSFVELYHMAVEHI